MFNKFVNKIIGTTKPNKEANIVDSETSKKVIDVKTKPGKKFNLGKIGLTQETVSVENNEDRLYNAREVNDYISLVKCGDIGQTSIDMFNLQGYRDFTAEQYINTTNSNDDLFRIYRLIESHPENQGLYHIMGRLNAFCGQEVITNSRCLQKVILQVLRDRVYNASSYNTSAK